MSRPPLEVADIFRAHWQEYCRARGDSVTPLQHRVASAIMACRTEKLGGHVLHCGKCGYREQSYNSCRNRHCPKCQGHKAAEWVTARGRELLPVEYFHTVFTLPHIFNELAVVNKRLIYDIFFKAVSRTLLQLGKRNLKCRLGFFTVLHTWGQTLTLHPHLHVVIPGCGLSLDGKGIVPLRSRYFLPEKILSRVFRGKFIKLLKSAYYQKRLIDEFDDFEAFLDRTVHSDWVVKVKPAFAGPEIVLKYLARYVQRIAISNRRLLSINSRMVSFSYRDYRNGGETRSLCIDALEFIRRFLLHTLPKGLVRVRHHGFLARTQKKHALDTLRRCLAVDHLAMLDEKDAFNPHTRSCPQCSGGSLVIVSIIAPKSARFRGLSPPLSYFQTF